MKSYEILVIFPPSNAPDTVQAQSKSVEDAVTKAAGKIVQKTELGKRSLGHPLKKFSEGNVMCYQADLEPAKVAECRKILELQESILKYSICVKQKISPKAAVPGAPSKPVTRTHPPKDKHEKAPVTG